MPDRELLPLADGSRWEGDCVVDRHEDRCRVYESIGGKAIDCYGSVYAKDAIAVLHRAGLLDELMKKVWDDGYSSGRADGLNDEIELTPNPYGKAASDGE